MMTVAVGRRVRLDVRLASGDVLEAGHHGAGDDGGDDFGHHRPYANHRSTPAHFPDLQSRDLTWTPHEAQSLDLRHLSRQLDRVRRTWSDCKGRLDLDIGDTPRPVYPSVCLWSRQLTTAMYFADHEV